MLRSNPCRVGSKPGAAEVPLADVGRGVAGRVERLGERFLLERQLLADHRPRELLRGEVGPAREPVGQVEARRMPAGHERGPGRRADGTGRIRLREPASSGGELVEVRGPVEPAPVAAEIGPAQVVGHDQDHVGTLLAGVGRERRGKPQADDQDSSPHGSPRMRKGKFSCRDDARATLSSQGPSRIGDRKTPCSPGSKGDRFGHTSSRPVFCGTERKLPPIAGIPSV